MDAHGGAVAALERSVPEDRLPADLRDQAHGQYRETGQRPRPALLAEEGEPWGGEL